MTGCNNCSTWDGAQPFTQDIARTLGRVESKLDQLFDLHESLDDRISDNTVKINDLQKGQSFIKGAAWLAGIVGGILAVVVPFKNAFLSLFYAQSP